MVALKLRLAEVLGTLPPYATSAAKSAIYLVTANPIKRAAGDILESTILKEVE
jgi:hypothetical protein